MSHSQSMIENVPVVGTVNPKAMAGGATVETVNIDFNVTGSTPQATRFPRQHMFIFSLGANTLTGGSDVICEIQVSPDGDAANYVEWSEKKSTLASDVAAKIVAINVSDSDLNGKYSPHDYPNRMIRGKISSTGSSGGSLIVSILIMGGGLRQSLMGETNAAIEAQMPSSGMSPASTLTIKAF